RLLDVHDRAQTLVAEALGGFDPLVDEHPGLVEPCLGGKTLDEVREELDALAAVVGKKVGGATEQVARGGCIPSAQGSASGGSEPFGASSAERSPLIADGPELCAVAVA